MNETPEFSLIRPCTELMEQYLDLCRESWGHVHDNYILSDPSQYEHWRYTLLEKYHKEELGIAIRPSERGKGYGRRLCPFLAAKARELGIREMLLTSEAENLAGIRCSECFPASRHEYREACVNGKWCKTHRTIVDLTDLSYNKK